MEIVITLKQADSIRKINAVTEDIDNGFNHGLTEYCVTDFKQCLDSIKNNPLHEGIAITENVMRIFKESGFKVISRKNDWKICLLNKQQTELIRNSMEV